MTLQYRVVDVFTEKPLEGNPLAVFSDGTGLNDATMQSIARELNLSETVFVLPPAQPESAAKLRIFTPFREMDFAGHPTIGAAFVLLDDGAARPDSLNFVLEENVGLVPIRVERGKRPLIWLTTPPIEDGPVFERSLCAEAVGLEDSDILVTPPQLLSAGNPTVFIAVKDKAAVDRAEMETTGVRRLRGAYPKPICTFVFTPTPEGAYSRMFARELGVVEDPATGSATGPLAAYMLRHKLASGPRFISEQGTKMGRRSLLHVQISGNQIEVGGYVTPLVRAVMEL
jgi:trans-2,3-dihydro-3-hydroxyanthranilate isomerase